MIYNLKRQKIDERDFKLKDAVAPTAKQIKLPDVVDLSPMFPAAYDQGQLGSCSANAGCANLVYLLNIPGLVLSRLYMYFKERELEKTIFEDSGSTIRDICKVAIKGVCTDSLWPYVITTFTNPPSYAARVDAPKHRANTFHSVTTLGGIKYALAMNKKPVLMGMEVFDSMESEEVAKTGLVPVPKDDENMLGGHAVLIVGYDETRQALKVRNSWGTNWGINGYFYLPYEYITKGLAFDFMMLA